MKKRNYQMMGIELIDELCKNGDVKWEGDIHRNHIILETPKGIVHI